MPVSILIVDDHAIIREGLKMMFASLSNMAVVGEAENGRIAVEKADELRPDVIIMDISMPELNGIEATGIICKSQPQIKIIILTMHHTSEHVHQAMLAGARAYILKESAGSSIANAVHTVMRGKLYFGEGVEEPRQMNSSNQKSPRSPFHTLSQREREIMQLVVEGQSNRMIGEILQISPKSVETYRSRLMIKIGVSNLPSLVMYAIQHGMITLK